MSKERRKNKRRERPVTIKGEIIAASRHLFLTLSNRNTEGFFANISTDEENQLDAPLERTPLYLPLTKTLLSTKHLMLKIFDIFLTVLFFVTQYHHSTTAEVL